MSVKHSFKETGPPQFANYANASRHPGKGRIVRALLRLFDGRRITIKIGVEGHENQVIDALMPLLGEPQIAKTHRRG
ncbi:hypothetical protein [Sandarakinorhabdus sp.]|uniref:hypothetical protein n=1 Tax=Sandarakinorhabdus sp. TaxID=1916663 RepID=UPI00356AA984